MSTHPNAVKLKDLVRLRQPVELPNGRVAKVEPFSFRMRELAIEIDHTPEGAEQDAKIVALVRLCVPSMTDEEAGALRPEEAVAIVGIAGGDLERVLAAIRGPEPTAADVAGNGSAPAETSVETDSEGEVAPARSSRRRSPPPTTSNT